MEKEEEERSEYRNTGKKANTSHHTVVLFKIQI